MDRNRCRAFCHRIAQHQMTSGFLWFGYEPPAFKGVNYFLCSGAGQTREHI